MKIIKVLYDPSTQDIKVILLESDKSLKEIAEYDQDIQTTLEEEVNILINYDKELSFHRDDGCIISYQRKESLPTVYA